MNMDERVINLGALNRHFEIVRYAIEQKCPKSDIACTYAVRG